MIVQGPDGAQIQFPDDTPPDVMKTALRKRYGGPPQTDSGESPSRPGTKLQEFRRIYPQYNDMSDDQLAQALHRKFYSDMPFNAFSKKIGSGPWDKYSASPQALSSGPWAKYQSTDPDQAAAKQRVQSEAGTFQNIDNAVRSIARGVPLIGGAMDEISAGLNTGFGYAGDYGKELAYQRERDRQYDEQHPWLSSAGQIAG